MGIPGLFANYYKKYKKEHELMIHIEELKYLDIKYLFFDYNSLIHPCAQQILSVNHDEYKKLSDLKKTDIIEKDIIENCINYTKFVINTLASHNLHVYIVIDGVAPRSKMNQQRERRYKSSFLKNIEEHSEKSTLWDSNKITPGTNFMKKMSDELYKLQKNETAKSGIQINISDSNFPGEGEHKMMRIIESLNIDKKKICIYGLDADLIMLSMINKKSDSIILVRDNTFNNKLKEHEKTMTFLNIRNLKTYIYNDIINVFNLEEIEASDSDKNKISKERFIHDYIIISFLLGNDFLEKIINLSIKEYGGDIVIKSYVRAWKGNYIVIDKLNKHENTNINFSLNLSFLKDIFYHLKNYEEYYFSQRRFSQLSEKNKTEVNCRDISYEKMDILNNTFTDLHNKLYFYNNKNIYLKRTSESNSDNNYNYKKKYYTYYGINDDNLELACYNYIEGIYWIYGYYNGHIHNNWSWYYKFDFTPFSSDIFDFLKKNQAYTNIENIIIDSENLRESKIYTPLQQLCMVLPKESLKNILKDILEENQFITLSRSLLKETSLYPGDLVIDLIDKEFLWQSKVFFKSLDEKIIEYYLELIN